MQTTEISTLLFFRVPTLCELLLPPPRRTMSDNAAVLEQVLAVFRFDNASDYYERVWAR